MDWWDWFSGCWGDVGQSRLGGRLILLATTLSFVWFTLADAPELGSLAVLAWLISVGSLVAVVVSREQDCRRPLVGTTVGAVGVELALGTSWLSAAAVATCGLVIFDGMRGFAQWHIDGS